VVRKEQQVRITEIWETRGSGLTGYSTFVLPTRALGSSWKKIGFVFSLYIRNSLGWGIVVQRITAVFGQSPRCTSHANWCIVSMILYIAGWNSEIVYNSRTRAFCLDSC
jgi:hypothetical protein